MNDAVNRLIQSLHEAKRDRDKYRAALTKIDAECQKYGGITPMGERWERIKTLAHDTITANAPLECSARSDDTLRGVVGNSGGGR